MNDDPTDFYRIEADRLNALAEIVFNTETRKAIIARARRYEALARKCTATAANTAHPAAKPSCDAA